MELNLNGGVRSDIIGAIRKVFARSYIAKTCRENALSNKKSVRNGKMYVCNSCKESFLAIKTAVDHIEPVVPIGIDTSEMSYDEYISRLFCSQSNLQLLCRDCHEKKTLYENSQRTSIRFQKRIEELGKIDLVLNRSMLKKKFLNVSTEEIHIDMFYSESVGEDSKYYRRIIFREYDGNIKIIRDVL
jgi:hypothetical protein